MTRSASDRYLQRRDRGVRKEIVTPEGVPVGFTLAQLGDRAAAFALDLVIIFVSVLALHLLMNSAMEDSLSESNWAMPFIQVLSFLLLNFYFIFFELKWQGSTPGKRALGIRVIDLHGGALRADAVFARNLVRDIEVWVPLQILIAPSQLWPGAPGWAQLLASSWIVVFVFMPRFNRDRLRAGDMVAGTLVVLAPKSVLLPDISHQQAKKEAHTGASGYQFTEKQLSVYGIYELQVLEDLLRQGEGGTALGHLKALDTVCDQIQRKIEWDSSQKIKDSEGFLRAFYAALRAHLERKMLFGKRREDKYSQE